MTGCEVSDEDRRFAEPVVTYGMASGKYNTICLAKRAIEDGIAGDFAECGVLAGGHPALMSYVSRRYGGKSRLVHLFDSFEGMPMAGPDDNDFDKKTLGLNPDRAHGKPAHWCIGEEWQVRENMKRWGAEESILVYHKGWLQETLPKIAPSLGPLATLRIDVDLYDSTVPIMEYLYDKVSPGGYVIDDDWGESDAPIPARLALLAYLDKHGIAHPKITRLPDTTGTVWWRK